SWPPPPSWSGTAVAAAARSTTDCIPREVPPMDNEHSPPPDQDGGGGGHTEKQNKKQKMPRLLAAMLAVSYLVMAGAAFFGQVPAIAAVFLTGTWADEHALTLVDALTYDSWEVHQIVAWSAAAVVALVLETNVAML